MDGMGRRTFARLAVASAVVAGTVSVATPAWAPKYILGASAYGACGLAEPGSRFSGDFTVLRFHAAQGRVWATAAVTGTCVDGLDVTATVPAAVYTVPVVEVTTECTAESAIVEIRPGATTVAGDVGGVKSAFQLDLYPSTVIDRIWMPGDPPRDRARLCAVHRTARRGSPAQVARALNELLLRVA